MGVLAALVGYGRGRRGIGPVLLAADVEAEADVDAAATLLLLLRLLLAVVATRGPSSLELELVDDGGRGDSLEVRSMTGILDAIVSVMLYATVCVSPCYVIYYIVQMSIALPPS
jgi:hypothetical protein